MILVSWKKSCFKGIFIGDRPYDKFGKANYITDFDLMFRIHILYVKGKVELSLLPQVTFVVSVLHIYVV